MATYAVDRAFTDYVHTQLALPLVYEKLNWRPLPLEQLGALEIDLGHGIDYVFHLDGKLKSVQERFRTVQYAAFDDFTIRYRRDHSTKPDQVQSEYYKLKADYLVYGTTNGNKETLESNTAFQKIAIIDLNKIYELIEAKKIRIDPSFSGFCKIQDGTLVCPVNTNRDKSSSFIPIDIKMLHKLNFENVIKYAVGY